MITGFCPPQPSTSVIYTNMPAINVKPYIYIYSIESSLAHLIRIQVDKLHHIIINIHPVLVIFRYCAVIQYLPILQPEVGRPRVSSCLTPPLQWGVDVCKLVLEMEDEVGDRQKWCAKKECQEKHQGMGEKPLILLIIGVAEYKYSDYICVYISYTYIYNHCSSPFPIFMIIIMNCQYAL